jgi:hypothetical protein
MVNAVPLSSQQKVVSIGSKAAAKELREEAARARLLASFFGSASAIRDLLQYARALET